MFTGIVQALGTVEEVPTAPSGGRLTVAAELAAGVGDSVAVAGCCLTVVACAAGRLRFDVSAETLRRTAIGSWRRGQPVNLEPALRVGDRLGGHIVLGHVDGLGRVVGLAPEPTGARLTVRVPPELLCYLPLKGSVAVDGVSLTVAERDAAGPTVTFALVPHTLAVTTLGRLAPEDPVHLEIDPIARYLETLLERSGIGGTG
jgi:riboflavin synthase